MKPKINLPETEMPVDEFIALFKKFISKNDDESKEAFRQLESRADEFYRNRKAMLGEHAGN
jgi:hypothetical protein